MVNTYVLKRMANNMNTDKSHKIDPNIEQDIELAEDNLKNLKEIYVTTYIETQDNKLDASETITDEYTEKVKQSFISWLILIFKTLKYC